MATTSTSSSSAFLAALLAALAGCASRPPAAPAATVTAEVCPLRAERPLRFVDVFDGAPEELATLIPDEAGDRSGHWELGYVYDAGRFVTIRCKYSDGATLDRKLASRVRRCDFEIDGAGTLSLRCG
jgi:hypothetical protein